MKIKIFTFFFVVIAISVQAQIKTPAPSPSSEIEQAVGLTEVEVEYSRPSMRDRTIFGDLVPYGKLWRTGANSRTKISFSTDVTIDGNELKKGSYGLLSIPNKDSWEIIFYTDADGGGAPEKLDEAKIALKVTAKSNPMNFKMETFTIGFGDLADPNSASLYIMWEQTSVGIKIGVPTDKITMETIESTMAGPSNNDYYQAAVYYLNSGKDLNQAKEWIDKAISANNNPPYWQLRQQSLIYAATGDKKGAIGIAEKSLAASEKAGNADYVKMNKESIVDWSK
jgi:hypothetical protein